MIYGSRVPALPLEDRVALARKIERLLMVNPRTRGAGQIEALCLAYGVSPRTGYRYAQRIRDHQCRCKDCGRYL
jgi:hypothetical protein